MKRLFWVFTLWFLAGWAASAGEVSLTQRQTRFTFTHPDFTLEVDSANGGRIRSWRAGGERVERVGNGGLLRDRFFAQSSWRGAILMPGPDKAVLRLIAEHPSGLKIIRVLTAHAGAPGLEVQHRVENPLQAPFTMEVESHPAGDAATVEAVAQGAVVRLASGSALGVATHAAVSAMEGGGVLLRFPQVPAGYQLEETFTLLPWLTDGAMPQSPARKVSALSGWKRTAAPRTAEVRARGYWLSTGAGEYRRAVEGPLELDLASGDERYLAVDLNLLSERPGPVHVEVPEAWRSRVVAFVERPGYEKLELAPLPATLADLRAGMQCRVWLRVAGGETPGEWEVPLTVRIGEAEAPFALRVKVWDVERPALRPFHVRGYGSGIEFWNGGGNIDDASQQRLGILFATYAEMGGDVFDWTVSMKTIAERVTLRETGEPLAKVVAENPARLDLNALPALDFSYFDPWLELARKHHITRVEAYTPFLESANRSWRFLAPLVGKDRVEPGSEEDVKVTLWYFTELRSYFESRGFPNLFCKISDEIGVDHIPAYGEMATLMRKAGWRPFTTITGMLSRTGEAIRAMNPHCDQWQLAAPAKDEFLDLLHKRYTTREETFVLPAFAPGLPGYRNGGATGTWGVEAFGPKGFTGITPEQVEALELLEDGAPLRLNSGSPWGNEARGVLFTAGTIQSHLYFSSADGAHPSTHRYELKVKVREESPNGEVLAAIDPQDELWYYSGRSRPYQTPYEEAWVHPLMAPYQRFAGYGIWAFLVWNPTERLIWWNEDESALSLSPAYCGYRDGWRDAVLLEALYRQGGQAAFAGIIGEEAGAALSVGPVQHGAYRMKNVTNGEDPTARNLARRRVLERLATKDLKP